MHPRRTILDLVDHIYGAVENETLWPILLERLAGTLRSAATNLFVQDLRHPGGAASATFGTDPSFNRSYADHYGKVNIFLIRGRPLLKTGSVCFSDELCPDEEAIRSEFFNDWVLPQGKGHGLLGTVFNDDALAGNIGAMRARGEKPFSVVEKRILRTLMPHLQRAVALKRRIAHVEALQRDNSNALDFLQSSQAPAIKPATSVHRENKMRQVSDWGLSRFSGSCTNTRALPRLPKKTSWRMEGLMRI